MAFPTNSNKLDYSDKNSIFEYLVDEISKIERYVAATYSCVDNEIKELLDTVKNIQRQLDETDGQVDRIERFESNIRNLENTMRTIEGSLKKIESKLPR